MSTPPLLDLVARFLAIYREPLATREISRRLLNERWVSGENLNALNDRLTAMLLIESETRGEMSRFMKVASKFTLRDFKDTDEHEVFSLEGRERVNPEGTDRLEERPKSALSSKKPPQDAPRKNRLLVKIRRYPLDHQTRSLIRLLIGQRKSLIDSMTRALRALKSEVVDWSSPDEWIPARLNGGVAGLARFIWEQSGRLLNPALCEGALSLISEAHLVENGPDGVLRLSERGQAWLEWGSVGEESGDPQLTQHGQEVSQWIDLNEGLTLLLAVAIERGPASLDSLSIGWHQTLRKERRRRDEEWIADGVRTRALNLCARGLLERVGHRYSITELGLSWLRRSGIEAPTRDEGTLRQLWALLHAQRQHARESLRILLAHMDPIAFEGLICQLLERMGYEEIYLTQTSKDFGVDVIASIELGITSVREVIQVKRQQRNIQRATLDALRGSLHRFEAVRGTLITTSDFSKGTRDAAFERGAAPITLIHGERLIDLLMEHQLGVRKTEVVMWHVEPATFESPSSVEWPRYIPSVDLRST